MKQQVDLRGHGHGRGHEVGHGGPRHRWHGNIARFHDHDWGVWRGCAGAHPAGAVMRAACIIVALMLSACAPMPVGPTVAAMPAPSKPFEVFIQDDQLCRNWAGASIGPGRDVAANQMLASTVTGAVIGAAAGALAGDHHGAGSGAAFGTLAGAGVGANQSSMSAWSAQRRYDIAYQQCMYAKGNVIPGYYPYPASSPPPRY